MPEEKGSDRGQSRQQNLDEGRSRGESYGQSIEKGSKSTVPANAVQPEPTGAPKSPLDKK
jgi:hypothetical protein